jgi:hypothetical protein
LAGAFRAPAFFAGAFLAAAFAGAFLAAAFAGAFLAAAFARTFLAEAFFTGALLANAGVAIGYLPLPLEPPLGGAGGGFTPKEFSLAGRCGGGGGGLVPIDFFSIQTP